MQNNIERAAQFAPFDALTGFRETLKEIETIAELGLIEEFINGNYLEEKINTINKNDFVKISHFYNLHFIETIGNIKEIDKTNKTITISNTKIDFNNILTIKKVL